MNTYKVTATRSDGMEVHDNFTEPTESAARKSFKECYRHDTYTITGVELLAENAQASKQQEREALEKIKKLVEILGPDSYLKTAFAGCFEDAEQNIENDFAFSMKERYEYELERSEKRNDQIRLLQETITRIQEEARTGEFEAENVALKERLEAEQQRRWDAEQKINEISSCMGDAQRRAEAAEEAVTQLKARLYDYMTAGA